MNQQISPSTNPAGNEFTPDPLDFNDQTYTNNGSFSQLSGPFSNNLKGIFYNNPGATIGNAVAVFTNNGKLQNSGTIDIHVRLDNNGSLNNITDGVIHVYDSLTVEAAGTLSNSNKIIAGAYGNILNSGNIFNGGLIDLGTSGGFYVKKDANINNTGTIDNSKNLVQPDAGFTNNGSYSGAGKILGNWTDHGKVKPGNSAGGMLIDGNYYKKDGSKEIELGGTFHGNGDREATEHDWIEITGDMELAGELDVSLINGFKLESDQEFIIVKVDGESTGQYDGLEEGDSVGRFANSNGGKSKLYISYKAGDGNDIALSTNKLVDDKAPANDKPPAGASLLFSTIAGEAGIKERKNGSFQMEMEGVESINWFTDHPERAEGTWKPQKLIRQWDKYFADGEPNAQTAFRVTGIAGEQGIATFEIFKPKITTGNNLKFKLKPISQNGKDKLTNLAGKELEIVSLFIDDANASEPYNSWQDELLIGLVQSVGKDYSDLTFRDLSNANLYRADLANADLTEAVLDGANLNSANLKGANLSGTYLPQAILANADLTNADLTDAQPLKAEQFTGATFNNTTCPDGTKNSFDLPCSGAQLNPVE